MWNYNFSPNLIQEKLNQVFCCCIFNTSYQIFEHIQELALIEIRYIEQKVIVIH